MAKLLYLVHRIPFPPNKGDKIRSFNFLKVLAQQHEIYLGCFIDDPADQQHVTDLNPYCREVFARFIDPRLGKIKSLRGLITGEALSVPYYYDATMQDWVRRTVAEQGIDKVLIFSSPMAQYVADLPNVHWVSDFVDVDSDKWRQYAEKQRWPMSWVYRREAQYLLKFEAEMARRAAHTVFVSELEAQLFQQLAPAVADKIGYVNNGVDAEQFDPALQYRNPFADGVLPMVFVGAMDYWANVDAMCWFAQSVLPKIKQQQPNARFYIVGSKPTAAVLQLAEEDEAVIVTGRVEDVRDYVAHAHVVVAPLRIARGIQNKVLEALAMAKPIVVSSMAMEGINPEPGLQVRVADDASEYAEQVLELLAQPVQQLMSNRDYVIREFGWQQNGRKLLDYLAE